MTGLVWRLSMRWRSAIDRAITPLGLANAQYSVLAPLLGMERSGQRPSQRQLADFTGLEPLYVSKLARALEPHRQPDRAQRRPGRQPGRPAQPYRPGPRGHGPGHRAGPGAAGRADRPTRAGLDSPATRSLIDSLHTLLGSSPPRTQTGADQ